MGCPDREHTVGVQRPVPGRNGRGRETVLRQQSERDERTRQMTDIQPDQAHHPALLAEAERRSAQLQLRFADAITGFAGSMRFVYLHAVVFAIWMLVFEKSPWPTLTLIVSLEAIFLSTFVMIGQNRQASFQQAKADHDFIASEQELHANTDLTKLVHQLTAEIH